MATLSAALFLLSCVVSGIQCAVWSNHTTEGQHIYVCSGKVLTIPWQINLGTSETIKEIQWYFRGHSDVIIAFDTHGQFITTPAYAHRASKAGTVGIELQHVTSGDEGLYTVEVTMQDASGEIHAMNQSVYIHVANGLKTSNGQVQAKLASQAVYDNSTQQWRLMLTCGHFTYIGLPPFDVVWTNPRGHNVSSTSYESGHFRLLLDTPVEGGNYSCLIPAEAPAVTCLVDTKEERVTVDETTARLMLLEARQTVLVEENIQLKQRVHDLETTQVTFLARFTGGTTHLPPATIIAFNNVMNNVGNAYDPHTGKFTAPFTGSYFFAMTDTCPSSTYYPNAKISSSRGLICFPYTPNHSDVTSCQGVQHLNRGQQAWVQIYFTDDCVSKESTFTGFLIHKDV